MKGTGDSGTWRLRDECEGEITVPVRGRVVVNNLELARQVAIGGVGIAALPAFLCADDVAAGRLERVLRGFGPARHSLYALFPTRLQVPLAARALIEMIVERIGSPPRWMVQGMGSVTNAGESCSRPRRRRRALPRDGGQQVQVIRQLCGPSGSCSSSRVMPCPQRAPIPPESGA